MPTSKTEAEKTIERLNRVPAPGFPPEADWTKLPLAVIDFETTGLNPAEDRIIEYGIVLIDDGKFGNSEDYFVRGGLINPGFEIDQKITDITGITNEQLKGKPTFEEAYDIIEDTLLNRVPVAYNAEFDREFLLYEVGRILRSKIVEIARSQQQVTVTADVIDQSLDPEKLPAAFRQQVEWIDPLVWARKLYKYERGKKLGDMCRRLKVEIEQAHRATADARAAGEVLLKMAKQIDIPTYFGLIQDQKLLAIKQEREFAEWKAKQEQSR